MQDFERPISLPGTPYYVWQPGQLHRATHERYAFLASLAATAFLVVEIMAEELFDKKEGKQVAAPQQPHVEDVAARLKVLEERYANLSRREQLSEQNMLKFERELKAELRALQQRLIDTRKHVTDVRENLETIQGQVANTAPKHELRALEAYLNLIQPLDFMTREEAKKLLEANTK